MCRSLRQQACFAEAGYQRIAEREREGERSPTAAMARFACLHLTLWAQTRMRNAQRIKVRDTKRVWLSCSTMYGAQRR